MKKESQPPDDKAGLRMLPRDPKLTLRPKRFDVSSFGGRNREQFEIEFFEKILAEDPCNEDALKLLGHVYTRRGDLEKGLDVDERLARLRPADAIACYNLACSYSLLQRTDEAIDSLEKAVSLGYHDMAHLLKDPDLHHIRSTSRFRSFITRLLGRNPRNS